MNPFAEKYKTLSNAQLVEITLNPGDYQAAAVQAAEQELLSRNLAEEELAKARAENQLLADEKLESEEAFNAQASRIKDFLFKLPGSLIKNDTPKYIGVIILIIAILSLWVGVDELFRFFARLFPVRPVQRSLLSLLGSFSLFSGIYLSLTAILFWQRKKWGWIYLTGYTVFCITNQAIFITQLIWSGQISFYFSVGAWSSFSTIILRDTLIYIAIVVFVFQKKVRTLYQINRKAGVMALIAGVIFSIFMHMPYLLYMLR
jgi:hypothetical protein